MTCEQAAWLVVADLERHKEYLTWALLGACVLAGLLALTAIDSIRRERP